MALLNYSSALNNLTDANGSLAQAAVNTYTTSLGPWAWFFVIFATMMAVYIKTQSTGLAVFVGLLFFSAAQLFVGLVGNTTFYVLIVLGLALLLFHFWRGQ
jgi:hypothetical protein